MDCDSSYDQLHEAFLGKKRQALAFIHDYNASLPSDRCPSCGDQNHVPGLRCPVCSYRHAVSWVILRDGEWGYEAVALTNRKTILATFNVELPQ